MKIIHAPNRITTTVDKVSIKVFMAGSIEMGTAPDWQSELTKYFEDTENVLFFNPRRENWDSSWEQKESNPLFNEQVNWELDHLEDADVIFLNYISETKSPISLLELGLFKDKPMIVCCPDTFWRKGNVDIVCSRFNIPLYESFEKGVGRLSTVIKTLKR